jgi:hypothetical protein
MGFGDNFGVPQINYDTPAFRNPVANTVGKANSLMPYGAYYEKAKILGQGDYKRALTPGSGTPIEKYTTGTIFDPNHSGIFGKPDGQMVNYGDTTPTPTLAKYQSSMSLGDAGKYSANQLTSSPWASMALGKQAIDQGMATDTSIQGQASQFSPMRNQLAMRGGHNSGASELMAGRNADAFAGLRRTMAGQSATDRASIGMQGAKIDSGVNQYNAQNMQNVNQLNVAAAIEDLKKRNEQARFEYNEKMKARGAGFTGDAIARSGG